jgi:flagella basal body P-ring formation protein FlgA
MRTLNIERRTPNAERNRMRTLLCSMFGVRCSMFLFIFLAALPLHADEATNSPAPAAVPTERTLDQAELTMMLTQTLQQEYVKDRGELELRVTQPWASKKISDEPYTVKIIELPTMGVTSSFIVKFELRNAHDSIGTWQLPVQAHVWREAWVAHSMLKRGDSLVDADIARERRDVLVIHEPLADFTSASSTFEIAEPVGIGAPLFARSIKLTPVVHRGQLVQALIEDGSLSITMKVEVLEDGAPGQVVRARNKQTLRDIRGKVVNEQTILVSL